MRILLGITLLFSIFLASGQVGNLSKEDTQANARPELKIYEFLQRSTYLTATTNYQNGQIAIRMLLLNTI